MLLMMDEVRQAEETSILKLEQKHCKESVKDQYINSKRYMYLHCLVHLLQLSKCQESNVSIVHQDTTHSKFLERKITNYQFSSLLSEENTEDFENTNVFSYSSR